jgi:hypothetical protein
MSNGGMAGTRSVLSGLRTDADDIKCFLWKAAA